MTIETVTFLIPGQKLARESMGFNETEQKAAAERISELTSRVPRSAEQVLADLEHATADSVD